MHITKEQLIDIIKGQLKVLEGFEEKAKKNADGCLDVDKDMKNWYEGQQEGFHWGVYALKAILDLGEDK